MSDESIQSEGGKARAASLTSEQRKAIASKAASARWGEKVLKATHKGSFKEAFGIDVECYVLDDAQKSAVLSERGMGRALGLSSSGGNKLRSFLSTKAMSHSGGLEMGGKLLQPVKFQWGTGGLDLPPTVIHGFDVTMLIDICRLVAVSLKSIGACSFPEAGISPVHGV
jgi:hypothetical protein